MEANMKNMMMTALATLCLVLGIVAAMGGTWLVPVGDDAKEMEDMDMDTGAGLTGMWVEMDMDDSETCDFMLDAMDDDEGEAECDGSILTMSTSFSDLCDAEGEDYEDDWLDDFSE